MQIRSFSCCQQNCNYVCCLQSASTSADVEMKENNDLWLAISLLLYELWIRWRHFRTAPCIAEYYTQKIYKKFVEVTAR